MGQPASWMSTVDPGRAASYSAYWGTLEPKTDAQRFERWIFAFMSVHTTWENNVRGYKALQGFDFRREVSLLEDHIRQSGAGLSRNRSRFLRKFHTDYWKEPAAYRKSPRESWVRLRERLSKRTLGLGRAKTTFALEMVYPSAPICCLDRHILRFMGMDIYNGNLSEERYTKLEARWVRAAKKYDLPPVIARHIYWDELQGKSNTRYWSHVLEE